MFTMAKDIRKPVPNTATSNNSITHIRMQCLSWKTESCLKTYWIPVQDIMMSGHIKWLPSVGLKTKVRKGFPGIALQGAVTKSLSKNPRAVNESMGHRVASAVPTDQFSEALIASAVIHRGSQEDRRLLKAAKSLHGLMSLNPLLSLSPLGFRPRLDSCLLSWRGFIAISLFFKGGKQLTQVNCLKWALVLMWIFTHPL